MTKNRKKFKFHSYGLKSWLRVSIIVAIFFLIFNQNSMNELKNLFDSFSMKSGGGNIFHLCMPFKNMWDASQIFNFIFFVFGFIIHVVMVPMILFIFFRTNKENIGIVNIQQRNCCLKTNSQKESVYIINSKFLC